MNIIEALDDPRLLGSAIKNRDTFRAWFTLLRAIFGLTLTNDEANLFRSCTGRSELPEGPFNTAWLVSVEEAARA